MFAGDPEHTRNNLEGWPHRKYTVAGEAEGNQNGGAVKFQATVHKSGLGVVVHFKILTLQLLSRQEGVTDHGGVSFHTVHTRHTHLVKNLTIFS